MAGIFNGSTSDLSVTVSSTAPDYPILMSCFFRPTSMTSNWTLVALSNDGAGSLDALVLAARGDVSGDPLYAQATAAGVSSQSTTPSGFTLQLDQDGVPIPKWFLAVGYFGSDGLRQAVLSPDTPTSNITWSTEQTTTRAVGNYTKVSIGSLWNGGASTRFNGHIVRAAIWSGFDLDLIDLAVRQLASGLPPNDARSVLRSSLTYYQPLQSEANDTYGVGASMTASNLTFGSSDGPAYPVGAFQGTRYRWPGDPPNAGPLPYARLVKITAGYLALVDAADTNALGAIQLPPGAPDYASAAQFVTRFADGQLLLEIAAGVGITQGQEVFQADGGKIADTGTVRVGVADRSGTAGQVIRVSPSWTQ